MEHPAQYGLDGAEVISLRTADDITITAWYVPPPTPDSPVVAYFHGNAGNISGRSEKLALLKAQGLGIMAITYRGYGSSGGSPTEAGLYEDARSAMRYLLEHNIAIDHITLYGESLGSGVAVQMATEFPVHALVLEAPYTSISRRAAERYPYIPVHWLLKDHFNSIAKIRQIHCPLLIFHGEKDETIPVVHGKRLFEAAKEPKTLHLYPEVDHTQFDLPEITRLTAEIARN